MSRYVELRRARPLLGTFVEIQARAGTEGRAQRGIDTAFTAIGEVQRLMSFHESSSDVSRLNRDAFTRPLRVHEWTWQVLARGQDFSVRSGGAFDITIAPFLSEWGYLPRGNATDAGASFRDIILGPDCTVRFARRLSIDLGGIAKGFAVDQAVEAMRTVGITRGMVNAGGDVRVFGPEERNIFLRDVTLPGKAAGVVRLRNRAVATSGIYFSRKIHGRNVVSPLVDGSTRQAHISDISVAVSAAECLAADALTKIVLARGEDSAGLLRSYRADAIILERGQPPRHLSANASELRQA